MLLRWFSAAIGAPLFLAICIWGRFPFVVGTTVLAAIALAELIRAYRAQGIHPSPLLAILGLLGPTWPLLPFSPFPLLLFCFVVAFLALIWEVARAVSTEELNVGRNLAYGLFCGLYISFFGGLVWLREDGRPVAAGLFPGMETGVASVLLVTFCVWATDTLAFYVGHALGRHKLAPSLSPAKTVEGACGGLVGGLLVGAIFGQVFWSSPLLGLPVGLAAGVLGQVGDLLESALKREVGVKDFGGIIPGHGGVMDRFDSLIFVAAFLAVVQAGFSS